MGRMAEHAPLLSSAARTFLSQIRFAAVATTDADGAPHQAVVWYRLLPDGRLLLNGRLPRRWCTNLLREPRVSIAIVDDENGYRWLGLAGVVEEVVEEVDRARRDIVDLAHRYHPEGPDEALIAEFLDQRRITYLVRITGVHDHLGG